MPGIKNIDRETAFPWGELPHFYMVTKVRRVFVYMPNHAVSAILRADEAEPVFMGIKESIILNAMAAEGGR